MQRVGGYVQRQARPADTSHVFGLSMATQCISQGIAVMHDIPGYEHS